MSDFGWGLVLLGTYVVLVVLARWIYIARPNVVWTSAQAGAMAKRLSLQMEQRPSSNGKGSLSPATLQCLLEELKKDIHNETPQSNHTGVLGWNGSHQIAQWVLMHEAERLALPSLGHAQLVARLERALGQLDELPQPRREAWEDVIRDLLASKTVPPAPGKAGRGRDRPQPGRPVGSDRTGQHLSRRPTHPPAPPASVRAGRRHNRHHHCGTQRPHAHSIHADGPARTAAS